MFKRILVPLDGSRLAERAVSHAALFARVFGAKIILQQTLDSSQNNETLGTVEPLNWQLRKAEADLSLREVAARLRENGLDVEQVVMEGRTPESIVDYAESNAIDLIVLSTHGASGLSRWNRSSVIGKVVEKAYTSVLIVRAYQDLDRAAEPNQTFASYRRILLPFDSSRRAECALPVTLTLINGLRAAGEDPALLVATVLKTPDLPLAAPYAPEINELMDTIMQRSRQVVQEYLQELRQRLLEDGEDRRGEIRLIENSSVPAAIHTLASEPGPDGQAVDLVVMCAHGQTGETSWPYGSVAQNYVEYGDKHILVIQDLHRAQVRPSSAEIAAEKYGKR